MGTLRHMVIVAFLIQEHSAFICQGAINAYIYSMRYNASLGTSSALFVCLFASRRASAQAVTSKWQLRTTSPMNTNSSAGENGFSAKNKFRWLRARLSCFSRGWPQKGPFGPFLGPGGNRSALGGLFLAQLSLVGHKNSKG